MRRQSILKEPVPGRGSLSNHVGKEKKVLSSHVTQEPLTAFGTYNSIIFALHTFCTGNRDC